MEKDETKENNLDYKSRKNYLDDNIDRCKNSISEKRRLIDIHYDMLRRNANDEETVRTSKKAIAGIEDEIVNMQKTVKKFYDRKDEVEKEEREYYRKEYEGYKETKSKETDKQADDGRVGE